MDRTIAITTAMRALADLTRRAILERVARSDEMTVVELMRDSGVARGAISQHLRHLKQAGAVAGRPEGRNVRCRAQPKGLGPLVDWMDHYAAPGAIGSTTSEAF